jgi:hypothetical protein
MTTLQAKTRSRKAQPALREYYVVFVREHGTVNVSRVLAQNSPSHLVIASSTALLGEELQQKRINKALSSCVIFATQKEALTFAQGEINKLYEWAEEMRGRAIKRIQGQQFKLDELWEALREMD